MEFVGAIFWIIFIQFIWFNTDAFIWWSKLFRLGRLLKIDNWEEYRIEIDPKVKYIDYIFQKYPNFFTKLFSCKPCSNLWVSVMVILVFGNNLIFLPIYYLISYIVYKKIFDKDGI